MIKRIAFMLVFCLVLSTGSVAFAATPAETAQTAIANLPDVSSFTSPADPGYDEAVAQVKGAVYALAELPEDEMMALDGYEDVFMAYLQLAMITVRDGMPSEVTTGDNYAQHMAWFERMATATDFTYEMDAVAIYTPVDPEDEYGSTQGQLMMEQLMSDYWYVIIRLYGYLSTLSDDEVKAIQVEECCKMLAQIPDEFTMDNIWEAGTQFVAIRDSMMLDDETAEGMITLADLPADEAARLVALNEQFNTFLEANRDAMLIAIDEAIETNCDVEAVQTYSPLKMSLVAQPISDAIWEMISLLIYNVEVDVTIELANYALLEEYDSYLYSGEQFYFYGDLNDDYSVDAGDALMVLKYAVGKEELDDYQFTCGDVDGDGFVNAVDALYILQYAVGSREYFPVEEAYFV